MKLPVRLAALTLCALALPALAGPAAAQAEDPASDEAPARPSKASIAVMPFTYSREVLDVDDDHVRVAVREFETSAFTNKFITALVNTRKFDVVERSRIDELMDEMEMSESGLMDTARAVRAGQVVGADYILMGEITVFAITVEWSRIPNTTRHSRKVTAQIVVDMRIVDTRTSRIVAAERGEVVQEEQTIHQSRVATVLPADMIDGLQRELCNDLSIKTIDGVYPIRVIGFSGGVVSLNRGDGGGFEVGQVLDVFLEGEELIDPDTGESLGFEEVRLGRIRVSEVLPRFSKAEVVEQAQAFPKGAVCRKVEAPDPEPAPSPRRGPRW